MFKVTAEDQEGDWTIWHNTSIEMDPKIYVHLDKKLLLIAGTTFLGEIKKEELGVCLTHEHVWCDQSVLLFLLPLLI